MVTRFVGIASVFLLMAFSVFGINDLMLNFREWNIQHTTLYFPNQESFVSRWFIANNDNDVLYINFIKLGAVTTLLTYIFPVLDVCQREKTSQ